MPRPEGSEDAGEELIKKIEYVHDRPDVQIQCCRVCRLELSTDTLGFDGPSVRFCGNEACAQYGNHTSAFIQMRRDQRPKKETK